MEKICKIVYFDEESVTDYVQIVAGGELEKTTEHGLWSPQIRSIL